MLRSFARIRQLKKSILKEFEQIVGEKMSSSFVRFLKEIGPDARTQRISIVIAAVLQYALEQLPAHCEEGSLGEAFLVISEEPYLVHEQSEEVELLEELIDALCEKAGMQNSRETSKGMPYTIAEGAITEFTNWYAMPWEDYV